MVTISIITFYLCQFDSNLEKSLLIIILYLVSSYSISSSEVTSSQGGSHVGSAFSSSFLYLYPDPFPHHHLDCLLGWSQTANTECHAPLSALLQSESLWLWSERKLIKQFSKYWIVFMNNAFWDCILFCFHHITSIEFLMDAQCA